MTPMPEMRNAVLQVSYLLDATPCTIYPSVVRSCAQSSSSFGSTQELGERQGCMHCKATYRFRTIRSTGEHEGGPRAASYADMVEVTPRGSSVEPILKDEL